MEYTEWLKQLESDADPQNGAWKIPGGLWRRYPIDNEDDESFSRCDNSLNCYSVDSGGEVEPDEMCFYIAATKEVDDTAEYEAVVAIADAVNAVAKHGGVWDAHIMQMARRTLWPHRLDASLGNGPAFVLCADCLRRGYGRNYIRCVGPLLAHPDHVTPL